MVFAVHLSDGVIAGPWLAAGWLLAIVLVAIASWKVAETEIPRIGVLTAAFFVGSQIHLPLGGVSAHLLLNGLLGVVLGIRAGLAIAVGLLLQALLFAHGGMTVLGVNIAIYVPPAMAAGLVCGPLRRSGMLRGTAIRFGLVVVVSLVFLGTAVLAAQWLRVALTTGRNQFPFDPGQWWLSHPAIAFLVLLGALAAAILERRLEADPEFAVGLLIGGSTAFATILLNVLWLTFGGLPYTQSVAAVSLFANLPVVLVEAVGVGFVIAFLAKARPEWIGGPTNHSGVGTGKISSNGTSH